MLRSAHGRRRVRGQHLAGDQPVEQHPHRRELLLHAGRRVGLLKRLYIGGDIERPDRGQRQAAVVAPGEEPGARPRIGAPRVGIADVGGEEFDIAPAGVITEIGDQRRHDWRRAEVGRCDLGLGDGGRKLGLGRFQSGPPALDIEYE